MEQKKNENLNIENNTLDTNYAFENSTCYMHYFFKHPEKLEKKDRGLEPEKIIYNGRTTIVYWSDGEKTISSCEGRDAFDEEVGLAMCLLKKMYGKKIYGKKLYKRMVKNAIRSNTVR